MKIFLQFILPIILPGLLFFLWSFLTRIRSGENGPTRALIAEGPWFRLILAGLVLMGIGLGVAAFFGGLDPEGKYYAPYLKDGIVVPGGITPKP